MSRLCLKPRPYRENNVQSGALCGGKMTVDAQNCAVQHAWLLKKMVPPATMATVYLALERLPCSFAGRYEILRSGPTQPDLLNEPRKESASRYGRVPYHPN